jgi:hypothetical protein
MLSKRNLGLPFIGICLLLALGAVTTAIFAEGKVVSSYGPINQDVTFDQIKAARMAVKAERAKEHSDMLNSRYDLTKRTDPNVVMSGGKPVPIGPTAKLQTVTWEELDTLSPEEIKEEGVFPYKPLPFADHAEGGMLFPEMISKVLPRLVRFGLRSSRALPGGPCSGNIFDDSPRSW